MDYRLLGRSGCAVSAYALGTMTFGSETDEETSFAQLDAFVEAGGTLLDCADVYGAGAAETIVGRWLAQRPADVVDRMVIVTKGRFPATSVFGAEGTSRRHLRRALEASLRRLGRGHVDMYMVHSWDPLTPLEETLGFLDDAVRAGLISYPGLSNYLGWQVQKAADLAQARGLAAPVALQPSYSLLVREIEWEIAPAAAHNGLGLLCWSPLGGGWLTGKYTQDHRPVGATRLGEDPGRGLEAYDRRAANPRTWQVLEAAAKVAADRGATMAQVALAWVAQRPGVSSVLLGARSVPQLLENLGAAELTLSAEEMEHLTAVSAPDAAPWPYGADGVEQRTRDLPQR
ncbi:aldo/keto reductase [Terrabacter sp. 2YAF2]|uniref:aldo/keto reductase n=1 Tax=Terrabacter sp. 2YAF2 TaxID=3233026 RepID=UPI003F969F6C